MANNSTVLPTGEMIHIGDYVCFKSDFEQCGRITKIERAGYASRTKLTLVNEDGFGGHYLRYATTTVVDADDCWIEQDVLVPVPEDTRR
jgi:hypothetical protein